MMINGMPISVHSVNAGLTFDYIRWFNMKDKANSSEKADRIQNYYTIKIVKNKYHLYIYSTEKLDSLEGVSVSAVFSDSLQVSDFSQCGEDNKRIICTPFDEKFVIPKELEKKVYEATLQSLLNLQTASRGLSDKHNDSSNETVQGL